jgi:dienelactone hydrolase
MPISRREWLSLLSAGALGSAQDMGSLYPLIESLANSRVAGEYDASFLDPRWKSPAEYRKAVLQIAIDALAFQPKRVHLRPEVVETEDLGDVIREKVLFSTCEQFRVPAFVHLPKDHKGKKLPGMIDLHSHGGWFVFGKEKVSAFPQDKMLPMLAKYHQDNYEGRPTATEFARRGYAVLTIDAFPFGERRIVMPDDMEKFGSDRKKYSADVMQQMNARCRTKESTIVKALAYAGTTWPGIVAWDDMRSVDYLASRPEVDASRIGCVGVSMGGYRSLLLCGLDARIRAACIAGFMSTVKPMMRSHLDTHSFVHFIPHVHARMDLPDIAALRVPKPLLVLQCKRDGLFPPAGMEESVKKLAAVYRKAGAASAFSSRFYDVPHIFNLQMQNDAFAWFDRELKGVQ